MDSPQALQDAAIRALKGKDWKQASILYNQLATLGSRKAWLALGQIYENGGNGVDSDSSESLHWYARAWNEGHLVEAGLALGRIYYLGKIVPKDYDRAFSYYSRFADTREPTGLFKLGSLYQLGRGVPKDMGKAVFYYEQSMKLGNVFARKNYAILKFRQGNIAVGIVYWVWSSFEMFWLLVSRTNNRRLRMI